MNEEEMVKFLLYPLCHSCLIQNISFFSEFHRGQAQVLQGDMFLPAMRDFQAQATCRLAEAEDLFQDMKTRVNIFF